MQTQQTKYHMTAYVFGRVLNTKGSKTKIAFFTFLVELFNGVVFTRVADDSIIAKV